MMDMLVHIIGTGVILWGLLITAYVINAFVFWYVPEIDLGVIRLFIIFWAVGSLISIFFGK